MQPAWCVSCLVNPANRHPGQDRILARDHGEYVRAERDVLTSVRHPFIVQLHWSFQVSTMLRRGVVAAVWLP